MMYIRKGYFYMKESYNFALEWISNGDEDLSSAKILIENNGSLRNIGYHCQQAVEKYLKAFLEYAEIKFPKVHDLTELYNKCSSIDSTLNLDLDYLINLTKYAVEIRYSKNPQIDEEALYSGYNYVQTVRNTILSKITEEQNV